MVPLASLLVTSPPPADCALAEADRLELARELRLARRKLGDITVDADAPHCRAVLEDLSRQMPLELDLPSAETCTLVLQPARSGWALEPVGACRRVEALEQGPPVLALYDFGALEPELPWWETELVFRCGSGLRSLIQPRDSWAREMAGSVVRW